MSSFKESAWHRVWHRSNALARVGYSLLLPENASLLRSISEGFLLYSSCFLLGVLRQKFSVFNPNPSHSARLRPAITTSGGRRGAGFVGHSGQGDEELKLLKLGPGEAGSG